MASSAYGLIRLWPNWPHKGRVSRTFLLASLIAGFSIMLSWPARAQEPLAQAQPVLPAAGFLVTPYVSFATVYDSNIFASTGTGESDTILRLSPGIGIGYRSPRTTFQLSYTFDADRFSRHSDLNSWQTRQSAQIGGTYAFTPRLTGGLSAHYLETYYPGELAQISALELTRTRSTRSSARPTVRYQVSPRTFATFFYDRAREHVATGLTTYISTASAAMTTDVTRRDQLNLRYQAEWYDFSSGTSPISRLFSIGWRHALSQSTQMFITAGPRDTDGRTVPDVYAGLSHDTPGASQILAYTRSQQSFAGQLGVYDTYAWTATFAFRPAYRWSFSVDPGYYRVSGGGETAKVYRLGMSARYWFRRDWSLALSYDYSHQRGAFGLGANNALVLRNVVMLALSWAIPAGPGRAVLPGRASYGTPPPGGGL